MVSRVRVVNYMSGASTSVLARVRTKNSAVHEHFDQSTVTKPTTKKTKDSATGYQPTSRIIWRANILRLLMKLNVSKYSEKFLCSFYQYCLCRFGWRSKDCSRREAAKWPCSKSFLQQSLLEACQKEEGWQNGERRKGAFGPSVFRR